MTSITINNEYLLSFGEYKLAEIAQHKEVKACYSASDSYIDKLIRLLNN